MQIHQSKIAVLVVDLDGTLIRSDMLFETFWSAFASRWTIPFSATRSLIHGRASLKRLLSTHSNINISTLPYNADVLNYIQRWRDSGGRTALVTASDQTVAEAIARHLHLFDEVHGSDGTTNLKGTKKAIFLEQRFGNSGFAYMGDALADLPVWENSALAITVDASRALRKKVDALETRTEHLGSNVKSIKPIMKAIRPHQWVKNTLVFLPMLVAHHFTIDAFFHSLLAFLAFSMVASSVYVLNDLLDLNNDRSHPRKKNRPFASGNLPVARGTWMIPLLFFSGIAIALALKLNFIFVLLGYYVATTAYSLLLKRRIIIDICTLAGLYTFRIVAGGIATEISLSVWLLAFSIFFFLSLAAVKRQAELVDGVSSGRVKAHGRGYHVEDLPLVANMALSAGYVSVLVMALYLNSLAVLELYSNPHALWGICLVLLYWLSRMVMVTHRGNMHDDPIVFAVKDRVSQICFLSALAFGVGGVVI